MDGRSHDWSSAKRRPRRQVPLTEFYLGQSSNLPEEIPTHSRTIPTYSRTLPSNPDVLPNTPDALPNTPEDTPRVIDLYQGV